ncbi:hypothetical protein ElyMa_003395300 [Elysia marginata]|uniref:Coiled-coil domain-containing protein 181 n=1 Tax=Elysia marginata TaxID=1093978 RepID=A0AAV4JSW5_9GAST|nr:hypothetical protein ElyMa_003395300 [Elysia marginata]
MNGASRPPDPELLGFLQTLVNGDQRPSQQDRTDSDKENEQARMQQEESQQQSSSVSGGMPNKAAEDALWDDFYNEEDFRPKQNGPSALSESEIAADHRAANDNYGRDRFESLERVEEEEEDDDDDNAGTQGPNRSEETRQKQGEEESDSPASGPKPKRKKRFFTKVKRPASAKNAPDLAAPTASGGSHPDLSGGRGERGGLSSLHSQQETMSETSGRGGRRLSRRKQVARPRCAGPEQTGDRLQQKYQELQMLMVRPLVEPGQYVQQTRQQLRRLEGISRQHAQAVMADSMLPPARGSSARTGQRNSSLRGQHNNVRTAFVELTHLKNSSNPALKKWLRRKDRELRKKKKEERAQQLAEELTKQEEKRKRETLFQDSDKKVKEWMVRKRKEAVRQAREERRRLKEEQKEKEEREAIQQQYNSPFRLTERPQSAPSGQLNHHGRKLFIPIIRPERPIAGGGGGGDNSNNGTHQNANSNTLEANDNGEENKSEPIEPKIPRPPVASKFVYKRPVSGRVRLMKLQQEKKADAKRTELEKMLHEKKLAEEKARKMRMSYDQWLIKKRSEDYEKRQEAARQRALAKSDPELERIIPEVARRRIENIQRGKRRVTTGEEALDSELNKSFGGGDFPGEQNGNSYRLEVSGSSLKQRPSSAKASLNPRVSKSPRRPQSAHPRVKSVMEENHEAHKNAFKLPFPAENGAPKHVLARQEKLFAHHLTHPGPSPTASDAQKEQETLKESANKTVSENSTNAVTVENTKAKSKTKDDDDKNDLEENMSSSFFVTEGNIPQADILEEEIMKTAGVSSEETQGMKEEEEIESERKQEGIIPESEAASENMEDAIPQQENDISKADSEKSASNGIDEEENSSLKQPEEQPKDGNTNEGDDNNENEGHRINTIVETDSPDKGYDASRLNSAENDDGNTKPVMEADGATEMKNNNIVVAEGEGKEETLVELEVILNHIQYLEHYVILNHIQYLEHYVIVNHIQYLEHYVILNHIQYLEHYVILNHIQYLEHYVILNHIQYLEHYVILNLIQYLERYVIVNHI